MNKAISTAFILLCVTFAGAQAPPEKKAAEDAEKLRKEAVIFLRETLTDVGSMRSLENRISFAAEIAGLMWFHDEREARAMYTGVISDFRDLVGRYDSQMNELGLTLEDDDNRPPYMSFMMEPTDKSRLIRKFTTAMGVRQQIAMSIAEHDADLAFGFYNDSLSVISNPVLREQMQTRDTQFEFQLLQHLAEKNATKAAEFGARSLGKSIGYQHIELLKKIYAKDADKGAEYAGALLGKLRGEKPDDVSPHIISDLIRFGADELEASRKANGKRPVYTLAELRELAEVLAQAVLSRAEGEGPGLISFADTVAKYHPGRAAQIRARFRSARSSNTNASYGAATDELMAAAYAANSANTFSSNSNSGASRAALEREAREKEEKQLFEDVQNLGKKELPKEEREKIVAQARKIIAQTHGRDKKIMALTMLASQVSKLGDKELAAEIMRDAERLVNPAPKTYQDFLLSWMLASGYAQTDPNKAFPILEETIGRANDTLGAFIKVGEFIDVAEEMIQDGEVQVGAFGGQMVRGLTRELGMADATIQVLVKADFAKTKALTNRFDRTEIRVLAKMMILRAVLNPMAPPKLEDLAETIPDGPVK